MTQKEDNDSNYKNSFKLPDISLPDSFFDNLLENEDSIMNSTTKKKEREVKIKYEQGIIKKNRIKFYKELNPDLLKEDERKIINIITMKNRNKSLNKSKSKSKKENKKKMRKIIKKKNLMG